MKFEVGDLFCCLELHKQLELLLSFDDNKVYVKTFIYDFRTQKHIRTFINSYSINTILEDIETEKWKHQKVKKRK